MESRFEVKTFQIRYLCKDCLSEKGIAGEFKCTGITLLSNPPIYEHQCSDCKRKQNLNKIYPYIEYEAIEHW